MAPAYEISLQLDRFLATLRDTRRARGLAVRDISNALGVSSSAISKYEKGCLAPSHAILVKWAEVLDLVTPENVRGRPEWQPPQHGTPAAVARHKKLKEDICHPCRVISLQQRARYHAAALAAITKELEGVSMNPPTHKAAQ